MTENDICYKKFLELLAFNNHPGMKYTEIQFLFFKSFYDVFNKIEDNPNNLKLHPNDYKFTVMFDEYINKMNEETI